jgi:hypothetical protein
MEDPQRPSIAIDANKPPVTDDTAATTTQDGIAVRGGGLEQVNLPLDQDTKKLVAAWIAQQGVPTILLFCILGFLAYSMVVLIPEIDKQRSQEIADKVAQLIERQDTTISKLVDSHDNDRLLFIKLLQLELEPAKPTPTEAK